MNLGVVFFCWQFDMQFPYAIVTGVKRRETFGSICNALLKDMVNTGRVGQ